ncbi:MAG: hypothetical protein K5744_09045 [Eubacterium sp.]|jgi:hypothetical protein|nr:hypothetical protein [Eubacterium sp.]
MEKEKCETNYLMLVTFSFDSDYIAVPCKTVTQAIDWMNAHIEREVSLTLSKDGYEPIVREIHEWAKELIYEESEECVDSKSDIINYTVIEIGRCYDPELYTFSKDIFRKE